MAEDIAALVETVQKNAKWLLDATQFEHGKPQDRHQEAYDRLMTAHRALAQRLADAERVVAAADHSAIPARDFLVCEWRDKAEEYRIERDAAEARATRAEEALDWLANWRDHGGYVVASTNAVTLPFEAVEVARAVVDPIRRRAALAPTEEPEHA